MAVVDAAAVMKSPVGDSHSEENESRSSHRNRVKIRFAGRSEDSVRAARCVMESLETYPRLCTTAVCAGVAATASLGPNLYSVLWYPSTDTST